MQIRRKNFARRLLSMPLTAMAVMFSAALAIGQTSTLNRPYGPVVLQSDKFSAFSSNAAPISQLFLYRYNNANSSWEQIPWQIDQVEPDSLDPTKTTFFRTGDGLLDSLDELSFMAKDAGGKAPDNNWVNDASARGFPRYEIELNDPLPSGGRGYVYLYRSTTLSASPSPVDYVSYDSPNDIIRGKGYEEGHSANGIQNSILVPVGEGGSGTDFLDRLKLRVQVKTFLTITIDENSFNKTGIKFRDGRIRVIRELTEQIALINVDVPLLIKYYGYSFVLNTSLNLTNISGVALLRQSFDFESNVASAGAKWYNQNAPSVITVDGNPDNVDNALAVVNAPNLNWYMQSSGHGSFVGIFSVPSGLGNLQRFYYRDDVSGGTNDGTTDTGTNGAYGESGLWITGTNITGVFSLDLTNYVLGKDQPRDVGEALRNQTSQPLQANVHAQSFTTGVTEATDPLPQRIALRQNSPNPVSPSTATTIRYELSFSGNVPVSLRIFNLLGQSVRELVNAVQPAGQYEARWDGRLGNGERAPAGIYFYQLRAGQQTITQKLMMLP